MPKTSQNTFIRPALEKRGKEEGKK